MEAEISDTNNSSAHGIEKDIEERDEKTLDLLTGKLYSHIVAITHMH